MAAALPLKRPREGCELVRRRLRELKATPRGARGGGPGCLRSISLTSWPDGASRRPPGRMDVYAPMTTFLKLHPQRPPDLRQSGARRHDQEPPPPARRRADQMLALCLDAAAPRALSRRLAKKEACRWSA